MKGMDSRMNLIDGRGNKAFFIPQKFGPLMLKPYVTSQVTYVKLARYEERWADLYSSYAWPTVLEADGFDHESH